MRIRFFLAVATIALVTGCGDDREPRTEPAPAPTPAPAEVPAAAPEASETALPTVTCPTPDLPSPQPDDTAIEPATYTVCDIGDPADTHTSNGVTLSGKHLDRGNPVTVCDIDEVTRLKLPGKEFDTSAFIVDGKARQLKGLARFQHDNGTVRHLVKITRANKEYQPPLDEDSPGCDKDQHQIIRIQFCYFGPTDKDPGEKWRCPGKGPGESGAHQGDIHAQN
jgi:hypothetical protein